MSNIATMANDQHICLICNQTIQGLEKYVQHKQNACGLNTVKTNTFGVDVSNVSLFFNKRILAVSSAKLELESGLIPDSEKPFPNDSCQDVALIFDCEIQKELDKINLSTFFKLIKQNDHPGSGEDVVMDDQDFVTGDNNYKTSLKNVLEHCRALNVCGMFSEKDSKANNASLKKKKRKLSSKLTNDAVNKANSNHDFALESLNQENLTKDVIPKGSINISPPPTIQRQIVTRLSTGIRKPSTRYFFDEAKILPPDKSLRIIRNKTSSQNVVPEDAKLTDGYPCGPEQGLQYFVEKEVCNIAQTNDANPIDQSNCDYGEKDVSLKPNGFVSHSSDFQSQHYDYRAKTGTEVEEHVTKDLELIDKVSKC